MMSQPFWKLQNINGNHESAQRGSALAIFPNKLAFKPLCRLALFLVIAEPALAQSIDLSPIQSLLQGIVDALTGPLGVVIATLAVLGVFLSWFFNIIDLRQALWVLVGIAGVAAAPTIVAAVFAA